VEHRLLVVGGKVVAATKGETVSVYGNGKPRCASWWKC
jgi:cyanophycin synthetase